MATAKAVHFNAFFISVPLLHLIDGKDTKNLIK